MKSVLRYGAGFAGVILLALSGALAFPHSAQAVPELSMTVETRAGDTFVVLDPAAETRIPAANTEFRVTLANNSPDETFTLSSIAPVLGFSDPTACTEPLGPGDVTSCLVYTAVEAGQNELSLTASGTYSESGDFSLTQSFPYFGVDYAFGGSIERQAEPPATGFVPLADPQLTRYPGGLAPLLRLSITNESNVPITLAGAIGFLVGSECEQSLAGVVEPGGLIYSCIVPAGPPQGGYNAPLFGFGYMGEFGEALESKSSFAWFSKGHCATARQSFVAGESVTVTCSAFQPDIRVYGQVNGLTDALPVTTVPESGEFDYVFTVPDDSTGGQYVFQLNFEGNPPNDSGAGALALSGLFDVTPAPDPAPVDGNDGGGAVAPPQEDDAELAELADTGAPEVRAVAVAASLLMIAGFLLTLRARIRRAA